MRTRPLAHDPASGDSEWALIEVPAAKTPAGWTGVNLADGRIPAGDTVFVEVWDEDRSTRLHNARFDGPLTDLGVACVPGRYWVRVVGGAVTG